MKDKKLFKKIAPIIMSAAVIMTSLPINVFATDFVYAEDTFTSESAYEEAAPEKVAGAGYYEAGSNDTTEEGFGSDGEYTEEVTGFEGEDQVAETFESEEGIATVTEDAENKDDTDASEEVQYVLMNIPYEAFYRSELKNNDVQVDAFTSATLNKSRTSGMMNGNAAYHTDAEGRNLAGVTFPVKISKASDLDGLTQVKDDTEVTITVTNRGQTSSKTYTGEKALIENANYAYYVLKEAPAYYKELTVNADGSFSFGTVQGMSEKTVSISSTFSTDTTYGDYELDLNDKEFAGVLNTDADSIYGVIVNTTDGTTYGLRHLENIWRGGHLSWGAGFTTSVHGCPVSFAHYASMMGKTISSVTYYTSQGIIDFDVTDTYVPVKNGITVSARDVNTTDTALEITFSQDLPADFVPAYAIDGTAVSAQADGTLSIENLTPGSHKLTVSDANNKYASIRTTFTASTDAVPAVYNEYEAKLVAGENVTEEQFAAYTKGVSKVKIGDKEYAASGRGSVKIVQEDGTLDLSKAEITDGAEVVVSATGYPDLTFVYKENVYVYAGLTWDQYWAAEGVYNATDVSSSDTADRRGEKDLGAFDAVTRATSNHGLHRGSFQTIATIYTKAGNAYELAGWKDQTTMILTDGSTATFGRGVVNGETIDHYQVFGLKYVPVKVKTQDYAAFKAAYKVVENGGTLFGGYGEGQLKSYSVTADANADTNGLKTAVNNGDGTFSFSARANGTASGIKDTDQKTADGITVTVKPGNGSYGEFLRVDLTGNYGGLGQAMQAVKWTYYGNDSTYSTPLQSYGTKFAADNWMHKVMGIQLGLSDSLRCKLPEGTDGTGYWTLTVYALGYADSTFKIQVAEENIARPAGDADSTPLKNIIAEAKALNEEDYTPESWAAAKDNIANELEECEDMLASIEDQTTYGVEEQVGHLREAIDSLVKAEFKISAETAALDTASNKTVALTVSTNLAGTVTWTSSDESVATVDTNGNVTAVKGGTAVITASLNNKKASCTVTVKEVNNENNNNNGNNNENNENNNNNNENNNNGNAGIQETLTANAASATIYAGGATANTTVINVTKTGIAEAAKFQSSNTAVATVDANGKVTAKKAGKATITVTAGKLSAEVVITVENAGITAKAKSATIYTAGTKSTAITVTKNGVTGKAKFKSSNKKVATVNKKGVVTAKKAGKTTITVTVGKYTKKVTVTVKKPSLKLTKSSATVKKGKTVAIKVKATPNGKVSYKTSNKKIATVSSKGVVKGKKKGTATITVTCNGVSAKFKVTVK